MTEELKPCPFCGGEAKLTDLTQAPESWVECTECGARTRFFSNSEEAADAWNARQVESELLKKYEAALLEICFCCAAVDCSLEQQSEALKAIDKICAEFYSIPEEELRGKNERR